MKSARRTSGGRASSGARRPQTRGRPSCAATTSSSRRASSTARGSASPTSCSRSSEPGGPARLVVRGRGHQARAPCQGVGAPPDLRLQRAARARSRASSRSGCTSRSAAATRETPTLPRRRLHGLLPDGQAPLRGRRSPRPTPAYPAPGTVLPGAGRALRRLPLGRCLRAAPARDDHLSLVAGIARRDPHGARRNAASRPGAAWPSCPCRSPPWSTPAPGRSAARPGAGAHPGRGRGRGPRLHELLEPTRTLEDGTLDTDKGLLALPEPQPG